MDNRSKDPTPITELQSKKIYEHTPSMLTDYSDLNSIAKDPVARNEILENDSFIDELCEKVLIRLRKKLASNDFCGPNCNSTGRTDCCTTDANV